MLPIICYLALILVSMAIAIVVYTLVILGWCGSSFGLSHPSSAGAPEGKSLSLHPYLASTFKYTKGIEKAEAALSESESCVVCLSGFRDGEDVCQLPNCKHSFHSPCIDMWLYSHSDCPICRVHVDRVDYPASDPDNLLDIRILS